MSRSLRSGKGSLEDRSVSSEKDDQVFDAADAVAPAPASAPLAPAGHARSIQTSSDAQSSDSEATTTEDTVRHLQRELRAEKRRNRKMQEEQSRQIDRLIAAMRTTSGTQPDHIPTESRIALPQNLEDRPTQMLGQPPPSRDGFATSAFPQDEGLPRNSEDRLTQTLSQAPPSRDGYPQDEGLPRNSENRPTQMLGQPPPSRDGFISPAFPQNGPFTRHPAADETSRHTREWVRQSEDPLSQIAAVMAEAFRSSQTGGSPRSQEEENRMANLIARQSSAKDLPVYSGDAIEWATWRAQFYQSTVTCGMTAAENLMRLQRALKGKARDAVSALLMDPAQVPEIMDVLERRFGSSHSIANIMLEKVHKLPRLQEDASNEMLVEFSGTIQNMVASLGNLKNDYLTNPALLSEVASKMPLALRIAWLDKVADQMEAATIQQLAAFLKRLTNAVPRSGLVDTLRAPRPRREQVHVQKQTNNEKCVQCDGAHKIHECPAFIAKAIPVRWEIIKSARLCHNCLRSNHRTKECRNRVRCGVGTCQLPHHRLLHESRPTVTAGTSSAEQIVTTTTLNEQSAVLLKVVPVTIRGPKGQISVHALLDEGSTITLIDSAVSDSVGANGPTRGLRIHGANGMCSTDNSSRRVKLSVRGDGSEYTITANTVKKLNLPRQTSGNQSVKPKILLGQDNAHLIVSREVHEEDMRMRSRTALGWITHGGIICNQEHATLTITRGVNDDHLNKLNELVKQNFAVDSLGITAAVRVDASIQRAEAIMNNTTRPLNTGRWETGLIWKEDNSWLPDNRQCALKRLVSLERKLSSNQALATAYKAKIDRLIERGYARALPTEESIASRRKWYLPHFAVQNPNKPGKLRVVFDAASRCRGTSLNDRLLTGPDLLSSLLGNLLRFREGRVAIAADIEEMFLQIKIRKEDQSSQLFLWRTTPQAEPSTFMLTSMMFGATCSPSSAQYVRNKIAKNHESDFPTAASAIQNKFYMDDYLDAVDTTHEATALVHDVSTLLAKGGFQLTNWASNDPAAIINVPQEKRATSAIRISSGDETERVLGLVWEPASDSFLYTFREAKESDIITWPTKRELLSIVMRIFDPVGFVACLTIRSKILLQAVWRSGVGWDDLIQEDHAQKWFEWIRLLKENTVAIPRRCLQKKNSTFTLHLFCDASEVACCTIAYLTEHTSVGNKATFISSKCKVAPLKPLSIPRLELQAALMAARLAATIKKESQCHIAKTIFWTDSTTVLCWLRTDPRKYSTFVSNRLGEIDELTNIANWRWVPTKLNPADIGTRDLDPPDLSITGAWFSGPSFITAPEPEWPQEKTRTILPDDQALELKPQFVGLSITPGEALPAVERFSSWNRLIRTTGWMFRFIRRCQQGPCKPAERSLRTDEILEAEMVWIKRSQEDTFRAEIHAIKRGETISKCSRLNPLTPFLQDGVLRMGSRLQATHGVEGIAQTPIILDGDDPYTRLLVQHYHQKADHSSTEKTMAEVRTSFFIFKLRTNLRKISYNCSTCQFRRAHPSPPLMGQLPAARLAHHVRPFTNCGLDYFGPMEVAIGRRREKRYGALFTCLSTRAVHLELVASLTADSTIMALQRMSARRGQPATIYSDNGTNFHGAEKEMNNALKDLCHDPRVQDHISSERIEWRFIPPMSPHMGGAWERLVRSVKRALRATLRERAPREETLLTALAEAEFMVNNRPLTHVSVDPRDEEPLTPNHFLIGSTGKRPHLSLYDNKEEEVCLRKQWRISQQLADMFWRRWLREYIPTMATRQKWHHQSKPIKVNDLVLIVDPALPRNTWPRGRVIETMEAADGQVRAVRVLTSSGTYVRPAIRIAVLKLQQNQHHQEDSPTQVGQEGDVEDAAYITPLKTSTAVTAPGECIGRDT